MPTPAEFVRYLRTRGWRWTLARAVETAVYASGRWVVYRNPLDGPLVPPRADGIVFRPVTSADVEWLGGFEPHHSRAELLARLADGCWIDVALDGPRPVAFRVVSSASPPGPLGIVVKVDAGQIWVNHLFCVPEYRGRGLGTELALAMDRRLATLGFRECLSANRLDNIAAIRTTLAQGDEPLYVFSYFRLFWLVRRRVSTDLTEVYRAAGREPPQVSPPREQRGARP